MDWPLHRLEDLTDPSRPITYGVVKPGPEDLENGVKFIRGGDIFEGKLAVDTLRTITPEVSKSYARTLLRGGEVVVSLVGNPGHVAVVPKELAGANLARQAGLIALRDDIDANFVKYFLMSPGGRAELISQMTGSVQVVINLANLRGVRVPRPPLPVQQRIAGILSAYDELIENCQRRIKTLEAITRALYREWFIHFRFPGHENHPRVASPLGEIPQGWEMTRVAHFGKVITGKTPSKANADFYGDEVPFVKTPDMHGNMFILGTNERLSMLGARSQSNKTLPVGSICVSCIGTIGVVSITSEDCQSNQQINSVVLNHEAYREFLFLRLQDAKQTLENLGANGATMGNVNKGKFESMEVICPPDALLIRFHELAQPMFSEILALSRQTQNLRRSRDLLLPRLLSGQIDAEKLSECA